MDNIFAHSSIPAQQLILEKYLEKIPIYYDSKICDFGSGVGNNLPTIKKFFNFITAVDISKNALSIAENKHCYENRIKFVLGSFAKHSLDNNSFDVVICTEVLEHTNNIKTSILSLDMILKKDGYLIISTPNYVNFAGIWKLIYEFLYNKAWDAWGNHEGGIEKTATFLNIRSTLKDLNYEILEERGCDLIRSWIPFIRSKYEFIDKHPFLNIGRIPIIKYFMMNYYVLAKKSVPEKRIF